MDSREYDAMTQVPREEEPGKQAAVTEAVAWECDALAGKGRSTTGVAESDAADETTGASPGTAQACDDLGLNSLSANLARFGIKPPGQA